MKNSQKFELPFNLPVGRRGCIKLYDSLKASLNLHTLLPDFQLEFGHTETTSTPYKRPSDFGIQGLDKDCPEMLVDGVQYSKIVHKALVDRGFIALLWGMRDYKLNPVIPFLESVIKFDFLGQKCDHKHLE